ncbi:MAG: CPBP family intramembrane metalloprotease [Leptolinea sp.]|nr:CPBP family intramembrane metalloprotease [Leptolinea sp.]
MENKIFKPTQFFTITYLITFICWIIAVFISYQPGGEALFIFFLIPGMMAPFFSALWMMYRDNSQVVRNSFKERLFNLRLINLPVLLLSLLIVPTAILIATWISIQTGGNPAQFQFAEGFSFSIGMVPSLLVLILAASFEELGWRGYAIDSLHAGRTYMKATVLFAIFWALWHVPLFFVNGTYQNEIALENIWYAVNFFVSIIPMAFIINWVYKLNRGSITAAIIFHFFINLSQEALNITQATKCIETVVIAVFAIIIVLANKRIFCEKLQIKSEAS